MIHMTIGERVAYLRKKAGLSQTSLMKMLKFDNLGKYETNERLPRTDLVIALANFFHVSTDWLLTGNEPAKEAESDPLKDEIMAETDERLTYQQLTDDEKYLLSLYHRLSERERAKAEGFMEGLLSTQKTIFRAPLSPFSHEEEQSDPTDNSEA